MKSKEKKEGDRKILSPSLEQTRKLKFKNPSVALRKLQKDMKKRKLKTD